MSNILVLVHTVPPLLQVFDRLAAQMLPGVRLKHILDEPLLEAVRMRGGLADSDTGRLRDHIALADVIGAKSVLVTCSTISPLVDRLKDSTRLPVFKIDEAMLDTAARLGPRIGVLATNPMTLGPTSQLLNERAAAANVTIELETRLIPDALDALLANDGYTHDRLVVDAIQDISARVDAIVLAQASMAQVLEGLPPDIRSKPILSSPHLALERLQPLYR